MNNVIHKIDKVKLDILLNFSLLEKRSLKGEKLILFDIDDTLLTAGDIYIWKTKNGKDIEKLTPDEYAKENIEKERKKGFDYDIREFRDPKKIAQSIEKGKPIIANLRMMDKYIKQGWDIGLLTARALEDVIYNSMKKWLMFRNNKGELENIGRKLARNLVFAINNGEIKGMKAYEGKGDFGKKANVIKNLIKKRGYKQIVFVDDDIKNVNAVKNIAEENNLPIEVIKAKI